MTSGHISMGACSPAPGAASVSATYVAGVVHFAVASGASRAALVASLGLGDDALDEADRRLPLGLLRRLFDDCAARLGDPAFALHFGVGVPCAHLTLASALAAARPSPIAEVGAPPGAATPSADGPRTLRDALVGLNRYASLGLHFPQGPAERYRFVEDAVGVWLEDCRPDDGADAWPALTESVMARFATGIRRRGGEAIVRALHVRHPEPSDAAHRQAYAMVFRVPVTFGAARNALCLDPRFLDEPLEPMPRPVERILTRHADATLRQLQAPVTWRQRVETALAQAAVARTADRRAPSALTVVCRALAVSRQTLHRRLHEEGTTFAIVHAERQRRLADAMLLADRAPVTVVASRLGFSEAAAFSRAYKRWTGRRPSEARRAAATAAASATPLPTD